MRLNEVLLISHCNTAQLLSVDDEDVTEIQTLKANDAETENSEESRRTRTYTYNNAGNVDILSPNFHRLFKSLLLLQLRRN